MSLKSKIVEIIDNEVKLKLADATFVASLRQSVQSSGLGGVQTGTVISVVGNIVTMKTYGTGETITCYAGSSPVGPGSYVVLAGGPSGQLLSLDS